MNKNKITSEELKTVVDYMKIALGYAESILGKVKRQEQAESALREKLIDFVERQFGDADWVTEYRGQEYAEWIESTFDETNPEGIELLQEIRSTFGDGHRLWIRKNHTGDSDGPDPVKIAKQYGIMFENDFGDEWFYRSDATCWIGHYYSKYDAAVAACRGFGLLSPHIRSAIYAGYMIFPNNDGKYFYETDDKRFLEEIYQSVEDAAKAICEKFNTQPVELIPGQHLKHVGGLDR